jgi:hypothetical protein
MAREAYKITIIITANLDPEFGDVPEDELIVRLKTAIENEFQCQGNITVDIQSCVYFAKPQLAVDNTDT